MKERDCANCKHHTSDGCSSWDCEFEARDLISRADAIKAVQRVVLDAEAIEALKELPSAELVLQTPQTYGKGINPSNAEVVADYISRLDAIRALAEHFSFDDGCSNIYKDIDYYKGIAEHILKNVPSALPSADEELTQIANTRKAVESADVAQGEWEDREVFNETDDDHIVEEWQSARCSVCGKYHTTPYMYYFDNFNFCPNCGARMKGGDDE